MACDNKEMVEVATSSTETCKFFSVFFLSVVVVVVVETDFIKIQSTIIVTCLAEICKSRREAWNLSRSISGKIYCVWKSHSFSSSIAVFSPLSALRMHDACHLSCRDETFSSFFSLIHLPLPFFSSYYIYFLPFHSPPRYVVDCVSVFAQCCVFSL